LVPMSDGGHEMRIASIDKSKLAKNGQEFRALLASDEDGIARSEADVRQLREARDGAYGKLDDDQFEEFVASLKFNNNGVSTGHYRPLMASLTISDIFEVFERFGMDRGLALDTLESVCENGQCVFSFWDFCSPLNCPGAAVEVDPVGEIR
jgi:hypothetical protein